MSAYLRFFELEQSPFEGKAQAQVVLGTRALREAFATIQSGLEEGASRICVGGGRGLGKTTLARALPKLLGTGYRVALVRDPSVSWEALRGNLAKQWGLAGGALARSRLIKAAAHKRLVLAIDQAELATEDFLDHLDVLLSYRSEEDQPVVQSVLLARLGAEPGESPGPLLWWLDRIQTLQLEFAPLPRDGVESYIHRHLKRAGWRGDKLFSPEASRAIHGYTGGIPGEVSSLCEKLLAVAATRHMVSIDADFVHAECDVEHAAAKAEAAEVPAKTEEPWTLEDEFEELVSEEEFAQAGGAAGDEGEASAEFEGAAPATPSLSESLEHFGGLDASSQAPEAEGFDAEELGASVALDDWAEQRDGIDPADAAIEEEAPWTFDGIDQNEDADFENELLSEFQPQSELDPRQEVQPEPQQTPSPETPNEIYLTEAAGVESRLRLESEEFDETLLDAPPTEAELRAIRGGWLAQWTRPLVGAALAAVVGGLVMAALLGGPDAAEEESGRSTAAVEGTNGIDPQTVFQPGAGYVDPAAPSDRNAAEAANKDKSGGIASARPQSPRTAAEGPTALQEETEVDERERSMPKWRSAPASPEPDFGWDDLR